MRKIVKKIKESKGAGMLEVIAGFFIGCVVIAILLNTASAIIYISRIGTFADQVSKIVSVEGKYDSEVKELIVEYQADSDLQTVEISVDGTNFKNGSNKIQLNDKIVITVTSKYNIGFLTIGSFPIPIKNKAVARSEVYWKE